MKKKINTVEEIKIDELSLAITNDNFELVKTLLDNGKMLEENSKMWKMTITEYLTHKLCNCIFQKKFEICKLLIDHGADINHKIHEYSSPLVYAFSCNENDTHLEVIRYMATKGANMDAVNILGNDVGSITKFNNKETFNFINEYNNLRRDFSIAVENMNIKCAYRCIEKEVKLEMFYDKGKSFLECALEKESSEMLEMLFDMGANISMLEDNGIKDFLMAIEKSNIQIVYILYKNGVKFEISNENNYKPIFKNNCEFIKILIDNKIIINNEHEQYYSAFILAFPDNYVKVIQYMIKKDIGSLCDNFCEESFDNITNNQFKNYFALAIKIMSVKTIKLLFEKSAKIEMLEENGSVDLGEAIKTSNIELIKLLLENGVKINISDIQKALTKINIEPVSILYLKDTYVDVTRKKTNSKLLEVLFDCGAKINMLSDNGMEELDKAIKYADIDMIQLLIKNGVELKTLLSKALKRAFKIADEEFIKLLFNNGAEIDMLENKMIKYIKNILNDKYINIINFLIECGLDINKKYKYYEYIWERTNCCVTCNKSTVSSTDSLLTYMLKTTCNDACLKIFQLIIEKGSDINDACQIINIIDTSNKELIKLIKMLK